MSDYEPKNQKPYQHDDLYQLTDADIRHILNEILGKYSILWPLNPRFKAQNEFMKMARWMMEFRSEDREYRRARTEDTGKKG